MQEKTVKNVIHMFSQIKTSVKTIFWINVSIVLDYYNKMKNASTVEENLRKGLIVSVLFVDN